MWRCTFVLLIIFINFTHASGRRFRKLKQMDFRERFLLESRTSCGKVPVVQGHDPLLSQPTLAKFGEIPWQVGLFYEGDGSFLCSGTLISSEHVLTSAICLISIEVTSSISVRLGDWDISVQDSPYEAYKEFKTPIRKVILLQDEDEPLFHPSLETVALIFLEDKIDFLLYPHVSTICLPDLGAGEAFGNEEDNCTVSGWGLQEPVTRLVRTQAEQPDFATGLSDSERELTESPEVAENRYHSDDPKPRSLTLSPKQEVGPIQITVPLFLSEMESEHSSNSTDDEDSMTDESESPRPSDVVADDYSLFNADHGIMIDPFVNGDLDFHTSSKNKLIQLLAFPPPSEAEAVQEITEKSDSKRDNSEDFANLHRAMFRHKQKYKSGKELPRDASDDEEDEYENFLLSHGDDETSDDSNKRNNNGSYPQELLSNVQDFPNYYTNTLDEAKFTGRAILKQTKVSFQKPCTGIPEDDRGNSRIGNSCIVPAGAARSTSLCMADLGSPVVCETQMRQRREVRSILAFSKTQRIDRGSGNKSSTITEDPPKKKSRKVLNTFSRFVLAGIVTWKRPCYENDENALQKFTVVTEVEDLLQLLFEKLEMESFA